MSVQMFLRFVALVEEPQGGIRCGAVQIINHYSGGRTRRSNERLKPSRKLFLSFQLCCVGTQQSNGLCHVRSPHRDQLHNQRPSTQPSHVQLACVPAKGTADIYSAIPINQR
jgi:hypothetical protein